MRGGVVPEDSSSVGTVSERWLAWEYPGCNPTVLCGQTDAGRSPTLSRTGLPPSGDSWGLG